MLRMSTHGLQYISKQHQISHSSIAVRAVRCGAAVVLLVHTRYAVARTRTSCFLYGYTLAAGLWLLWANRKGCKEVLPLCPPSPLVEKSQTQHQTCFKYPPKAHRTPHINDD